MNKIAYALLMLTTLFWGGNAVAGKLAIGHISPMLLTSGRWLLALAILLALGWRRLVADWPIVRRQLPLLFALGFFGFTVYNVALYNALIHTTAINVSVEHSGMPMLIFLLNFLFFRVAVGPLQMVGLLLSVAGIVLTASHGEPTRLLDLDVNFGDALVIVAVITYSAYTVALRYKPAIHWQSLMIMLTATAVIGSLPFTAVEYGNGTLIWPDLTGWTILTYVVICPSILSQVFYIRGVELIGPNRAGLFINLVPIFGTFLSVAILGEDFHLYHAVALAMVFGGIWLAERGRGDRKAEPQSPTAR